MVYNKFFFQILIRVAFIVGIGLAVGYIFPREDLLFTQIILFIMLLALIWELTSFLNKTNQDLTRFLASVKDRDFTVSFNESKGNKSFKELGKAFNELAAALRELETHNAGQSQFLTLLINQMEFGVITFDKEEKITLINDYATKLLHLPAITDWKKIQNANVQVLREFLAIGESSNQLIETKIGERQQSFSVSATSVIIRQASFKIVTFQDIQSEIQQKEIEAWQSLIRILTHEIMNSVTPVVSLTDTVRMILRTDDGEMRSLDQLEEDSLEDIHEALNIIHERGNGIIDFVSNYRRLTRVPIPDPHLISITEMIEGILSLMNTSLNQHKIILLKEIQKADLMLDQALVSQVLINLIKNAIEAMSESSKTDHTLIIQGKMEDLYYVLAVKDSADGIPDDKTDQVFVPFFTTKQEGSGIGLSLSRQIMRAHGGALELRSTSAEGTVFELKFSLV